jgi:hypothetical protein
VEFVIAGIGVVLTVWMILASRGRHRRGPRDDAGKTPDA